VFCHEEAGSPHAHLLKEEGMLSLLQAASPAGPGSRLSLPDLQVPSAELPRTEAQAEHAPARLHLASLP